MSLLLFGDLQFGDSLPLILLVGTVVWCIGGTVLLRLACGVVKLATEGPAPQPAASANPSENAPEQKDPSTAPDAAAGSTRIHEPDVGSAVGLVILHAVILGAAALLVRAYEALMYAMGGSVSGFQAGALLVVGVLAGPVAVIAVNRKALQTTWLKATLVSIGYLVGAAMLELATAFLVLYLLGK